MQFTPIFSEDYNLFVDRTDKITWRCRRQTIVCRKPARTRTNSHGFAAESTRKNSGKPAYVCRRTWRTSFAAVNKFWRTSANNSLWWTDVHQKLAVLFAASLHEFANVHRRSLVGSPETFWQIPPWTGAGSWRFRSKQFFAARSTDNMIDLLHYYLSSQKFGWRKIWAVLWPKFFATNKLLTKFSTY